MCVENGECNIPVDVPGDEKFVRAIKTPVHINAKGAPRSAAFRPVPGYSVVSVIRHLMGDNFCKDKSVHIANAQYVGMLVGRAGLVRDSGWQLEDYREDYCGHAHIDVGYTPEKNVPLDAEVNERFLEICGAILKETKYHVDPSPTVPGWSGPPL